MSQNRSSAVMAQRSEPHDSLDFFPTPPWATRALLNALGDRDLINISQSCWEPACGEGAMVGPLSGCFKTVYASDVHDYGAGAVGDFLWPHDGPVYDWIITNPPFRLGAEFALTAIERARVGAAFLVRTAFLEGGERLTKLFQPHPPFMILQFAERVPMVKGRLDAKASTATSYCWIVWLNSYQNSETHFAWIPPCRKALERSGDYPEAAE